MAVASNIFLLTIYRITERGSTNSFIHVHTNRVSKKLKFFTNFQTKFKRISLSFNPIASPNLTALMLSIDAMYLLDVVITNMFTAHYNDRREIIISKKHLFKMFYKNKSLLLYYFLAIFPFYLIKKELRIIKLVTIMEISKLFALVQSFPRLLLRLISSETDFQRRQKFLISLITLMTELLISIHFAGCIHMYFNKPEDFVDKGIEDSNFYLSTVYFMLTTFATIGYGDLNMNTSTFFKTFLMVFILILGVQMIEYIIASLKQTFSKFEEINQKTNDKFDNFELWLAVREFTKDVYIPTAYSKQVKQYFNFLYRNNYVGLLNDSNFYQKLTVGTAWDLYCETSEKQKHMFNWFFCDFTDLFVQQIILNLVPKSFSKDDVVIIRGTQSEGLYFLIDGEITSYYKETWNENKIYCPGKIFGEFSLHEQKSFFTYR